MQPTESPATLGRLWEMPRVFPASRAGGRIKKMMVEGPGKECLES